MWLELHVMDSGLAIVGYYVALPNLYLALSRNILWILIMQHLGREIKFVSS